MSPNDSILIFSVVNPVGTVLCRVGHLIMMSGITTPTTEMAPPKKEAASVRRPDRREESKIPSSTLRTELSNHQC
jgi:hypothetical protein